MLIHPIITGYHPNQSTTFMATDLATLDLALASRAHEASATWGVSVTAADIACGFLEVKLAPHLTLILSWRIEESGPRAVPYGDHAGNGGRCRAGGADRSFPFGSLAR
jgi:hypothetical protein